MLGACLHMCCVAAHCKPCQSLSSTGYPPCRLSAFNDAVLMVDCETDAWLLRWGNTQFEELAGGCMAAAVVAWGQLAATPSCCSGNLFLIRPVGW